MWPLCPANPWKAALLLSPGRLQALSLLRSLRPTDVTIVSSSVGDIRGFHIPCPTPMRRHILVV
jgi:hypothetical protein